MLKHPLFGLAACLVSTVFSQTIKVSGTVKDAANKPIANAIVELVLAKAKDTTGADGAYSLSVTPNSVQRSDVSMAGKVSLQQGMLELATAQAAPIRIEIFDVKGNLVDRMAMEMASAGTYRLNLAGRVRSQNLVLVKASVGRTTKAFRYLPKGFVAMSTSHSPEFTAQAGASLAKVAAAVDTLRVSASGFTAKSVVINALESTVDMTLEISSDIWGGLKNPPVKSAGCGKPTTVKTGAGSLTSGGANRPYVIDVPANYDMNHPHRVFFNSHGQGSNTSNYLKDNYYDMKPNAAAANEPGIFFGGQGYGGSSSTSGSAWGEKDHAFFDDVITFLKNNLCIDETRIFTIGMSMGGMQTYALSTTRAKKIRAGVGIAPANFNIWLPATRGTDPEAWMQTTGMSDGTTPWVSNEAQKRGSKFIALEKAANNGCTIPAEIPIWKSGAHVCYDFQGCKPGYPVKACTFNGGHSHRASDPGSSVNWIGVESYKFFTQF